MKNIILVDASYTSFHRFYATLRWMSFSDTNKETYKKYKNDPEYDWTKNTVFIEKYEKMYLEAIKKLVTNKVYKDSIVIFCQDSPQDSIWRHEYIKCYKGKREDHSKKINIKAVFKYTYEKIIPKLVKENTNIYKMMIQKMEGDDIIAICSKYIRQKHESKFVYIISGDKDFYQLGYDNLYFADYKKKEHLNLTRKEAKHELVKKIIEGDCSDNIPSIFKNIKITKKEKEELINDKKKLIDYLNKNKNIRKRYIKNRMIISFKYIPKLYQKKVLNIIKNII